MGFNVVLVNPQIPTNTGNIGRLCLATGAILHLIEPLGFEISDTRLKRAGLDYWQHLDVNIYSDFDDFLDKNPRSSLRFFTAHAEKTVWDLNFQENDFLVFGKESDGLSQTITEKFKDYCYRIPLYDKRIRSLNLANAAAIVLYEGKRQLASC